jgi:serine/threonine-protein kinase RsbW
MHPGPGTEVEIAIPARATALYVLRTVVAGLAAGAGFSYEEIEDLRLAVDEAAARLLSDVPRAERVHLVAAGDGHRLELVVSVEGAPEPVGWPTPELETTLTWKVLPALVDDVEAIGAPRPAFRLRKRAATQGASG